MSHIIVLSQNKNMGLPILSGRLDAGRLSEGSKEEALTVRGN